MPTYDYKCPKCDQIDSYNKSIDSKDFIICLSCARKGENNYMQKQVSKPAVHFKGTGFYETDYKGK